MHRREFIDVNFFNAFVGENFPRDALQILDVDVRARGIEEQVLAARGDEADVELAVVERLADAGRDGVHDAGLARDFDQPRVNVIVERLVDRRAFDDRIGEHFPRHGLGLLSGEVRLHPIQPRRANPVRQRHAQGFQLAENPGR